MVHPRHNAGFRACRRTGPKTCACVTHTARCRGWVTVYHGGEAAIDDDPECPWIVMCEEHSGLVSCETRAIAEAVMREGSLAFCDDCRQSDAGGER